MQQPGIEHGPVPWQGTTLSLDHRCCNQSKQSPKAELIPIPLYRSRQGLDSDKTLSKTKWLYGTYTFSPKK